MKTQTEILMPPCTFDEILKSSNGNLVIEKTVSIHNGYNAHVELLIPGNLVIRLRSYDLTEDQFNLLIFHGFNKR